ncbi:16S rRNA (uracil(1498)-N(3))-methyltransferase [Trinickia dinghuensis]|uniref:Ribosomal RNA small subunit methyltransferase E n=1 Tax=Trinickia dinghuensis TaxID=2291023 RepID=A0A3D8JQD4_9BURK|nr:16S rRNA (uracil(1498)-N(3))-methyltransferase [Trinickia dinghuensis]RDU94754.1 16S rRNA (uracil(1498)-N(3))-methyltransferase [Trinickia dinghuensis]
MPRFFVDSDFAPGDVVALPEEVARHVQVLRLAAGDTLTLFNGRGGQHDARLVEIGRRSALAEIGAFTPIEAETPYRITLAQGIAGGDKMDWLIEKAIELGVSRIAPLVTARGVVRLSAERAGRRQAHWQGIVRAACEQCGRNRLAGVDPALDLSKWLETLPAAGAASDAGAMRLMLSPRAVTGFASLPESPPSGDVTLLIGPEGGLSPEEEDAAAAHGFTPLSLGPRVLRTETAGIAVLAALAARWGGW